LDGEGGKKKGELTQLTERKNGGESGKSFRRGRVQLLIAYPSLQQRGEGWITAEWKPSRKGQEGKRVSRLTRSVLGNSRKGKVKKREKRCYLKRGGSLSLVPRRGGKTGALAVPIKTEVEVFRLGSSDQEKEETQRQPRETAKSSHLRKEEEVGAD